MTKLMLNILICMIAYQILWWVGVAIAVIGLTAVELLSHTKLYKKLQYMVVGD